MDTEDSARPDVLDDEVDRRVAASLWVRWRHCGRDGQVHAFPVEDSEYGRWPQSVCDRVVPPGVLRPDVTGRRCPECVLGVRASGTGRRHRRIDPPGLGARVLARWRRSSPGRQATRFPVSAPPLTSEEPAERNGRVPGTAEPGTTAQGPAPSLLEGPSHDRR